jgi:hypothetical protein
VAPTSPRWSGRTNANQPTIDDPDSPTPTSANSRTGRRSTTPYRSVSPPPAEPIGALNLYTTSGPPFSDGSARIDDTFAGIVLATVGRVDDAATAAHRLQQALASRALISEAQGILMAEHHCSRGEAVAALLPLSQHQGVRLQQVAQALVHHAASS